MIGHEGRDEIIAMVVAALGAQGEGDAGLLASRLQQLRLELLGQELIGITIVDQEFPEFRTVFDQGDGIVLAPGIPVVAEIAAQRLDSLGHA
jgi:hypothetical protein